jgi:hypothetical protein
MEDYSIIRGQTTLEVMFVLLSIIIFSYVYMSWKACVHRTSAAESKLGTGRPNMPGQMSPNVSPGSSSASPPRLWWEKHKSSIGDWVAPILAWAAVIWITLALISALLGES